MKASIRNAADLAAKPRALEQIRPGWWIKGTYVEHEGTATTHVPYWAQVQVVADLTVPSGLNEGARLIRLTAYTPDGNQISINNYRGFPVPSLNKVDARRVGLTRGAEIESDEPDDLAGLASEGG